MYHLIAFIIGSLVAVVILAWRWKRLNRWVHVLLFVIALSGLVNIPLFLGAAWVDWKVLDASQRRAIQSYLDGGAMITDGTLDLQPYKHTVAAYFPDGHPRAGSGVRVVLFPYEPKLGQSISAGLITALILGLTSAGVFALFRNGRRDS
ncbi:MAG: hypothetical protein R3C45_01515 [Phycisphaerales bacterium]